MPRDASTVQSVVRALDLLAAISAAEEVGLTELARRAGLGPSTVHRLLRTLVECEYVVQNPETSRYRMSHKLLQLAGGLERRISHLRSVASPHLHALRDATDESTNLVMLDGYAAVYVDQVQSSHPIRMFTQIGGRVPAYASGAGKAMLAFQSDRVVAEVMRRAPFQQLTPHTLILAEALASDLARVRARGFAVDNEEFEIGVLCVAAPIFSHEGSTLAAISVSGPAARLGRHDRAELGEMIAHHALDVSSELGYSGSAARGSATSTARLSAAEGTLITAEGG